MSLDFSSVRVEDLMDREWTLVNHLGGYASSSVAGINTRKYHGLLVAAMQPPLKRMVILSRVEDAIIAGGRHVPLSSCEYPGGIHPTGHRFLRAFNAVPYPRWAYQGEGWTIEKNLRLVEGQNTAILTYTLLTADQPVQLELKPLFALRGIHDLMYQWTGHRNADAADRAGRHYCIAETPRTPTVYFAQDGTYTSEPNWYLATIYRREIERGYSGLEDLWMPGVCRWTLEQGKSVHFACSTDPIDLDRLIERLSPDGIAVQRTGARDISSSARSAGAVEEIRRPDGAVQSLLRASDQFIASDGKGKTTLMARFPWSPVLVRDALIGFSGTLLVPRRFAEARSFLDQMLPLLRDGLLPSSLPEDGSPPVYTAADTSLWFIQAIFDYLRYSRDTLTVAPLYKAAMEIIQRYRSGTALGIQCDAEGLLTSRWPATPVTWMDAKCGDWVITPRHGRAVEIQALWYNALRIVSGMSERSGNPALAGELSRLAVRCKAAFNDRFWNPDTRCLHDVVLDRGADPSIRPNQIFTISLPHSILAAERHATVLERVRQFLLTPMGLRTLCTDEPSYQGRYAADVVSRDRAYHQGCAFPWLLGPFITAMIRTYGQSDSVLRLSREILQPSLTYLQNDGLGQICELFDGDSPQRPGGAITSVRSVAEILRCFMEDVLDVRPLPGDMPIPSESART